MIDLGPIKARLAEQPNEDVAALVAEVEALRARRGKHAPMASKDLARAAAATWLQSPLRKQLERERDEARAEVQALKHQARGHGA